MLGEFELIGKYLVPLANNSGSLGLSDDVAVIQPPPEHELAVTKDMLKSGIHFFQDDAPDSIAKKALRSNLSDIIAKGAEPMGYMMGLGLPAQWSEDRLQAFCNGLKDDQEKYGVDLYGGDLISTPDGLCISITMIGKAPVGQTVKRSTANSGDRLYVTGTVGDSALGLCVRKGDLPNLSEECQKQLIGSYLLPDPPLKAVQSVRRHASASTDISDGLVADLEHICNSSGVGAVLSVPDVPVSSASRDVLDTDPRRIRDILTGGDDYQVLITVPGSAISEFERQATADGVIFTEIGRMIDDTVVRLENSDGSTIGIGETGHDHFRKT